MHRGQTLPFLLLCLLYTHWPEEGSGGNVANYNDSQRAGRSWDVNPMNSKFSVPIQPDSKDHPAPCTFGTMFLVKREGRCDDQPKPLIAEIANGLEP